MTVIALSSSRTGPQYLPSAWRDSPSYGDARLPMPLSESGSWFDVYSVAKAAGRMAGFFFPPPDAVHFRSGYPALKGEMARMALQILGRAEANREHVQTSLRYAIHLAFALEARGVRPPRAMISNDGTLGLYWRSATTYISIDADTDGELPFGIAKGMDVTSGIWTVNIDEPVEVPSMLLDALRAL